MNNKILQKCIDELNKEDFSKQYVLGMLETIIEMNVQPLIYPIQNEQIKNVDKKIVSDEEAYLQKYTEGIRSN